MTVADLIEHLRQLPPDTPIADSYHKRACDQSYAEDKWGVRHAGGAIAELADEAAARRLWRISVRDGQGVIVAVARQRRVALILPWEDAAEGTGQ